MPRLGYALPVTAAALLLSACSTTPSAKNLTPLTPVSSQSSGLTEDFAGAWFVTAVLPHAATHQAVKDRHIGNAVLLKEDHASDINGHRCASPDLLENRVSEKAAGLDWQIPGDIARLQVTCGGKAFATYLQVPESAVPFNLRPKGGSMMDPAVNVLVAARPEATYLMERAEQILARQNSGTSVLTSKANLAAKPVVTSKPVETKVAKAKIAPASVKPAQPKTAMATVSKKPVSAAIAAKPADAKSTDKQNKSLSMKSMPALASTTNVATKPTSSKPAVKPMGSDKAGGNGKPVLKLLMAKPIDKAPAPGDAIHLASYTDMTTAARGWQTLQNQYAELAPLKPIYVSTDIAGKGKMIRLFATGAPSGKLQKICTDLQSQQAYCALHP